MKPVAFRYHAVKTTDEAVAVRAAAVEMRSR